MLQSNQRSNDFENRVGEGGFILSSPDSRENPDRKVEDGALL